MTTLADLHIDEDRLRRLLTLAFEEDFGSLGDITTQAAIGLPDAGTNPSQGSGACAGDLIAKADGVVCGLALIPCVLGSAPPFCGMRLPGGPATRDPQRASDQAVLPATVVPCGPSDGDWVTAGTILTTLLGDRAAILAIERTLLNFLQRLSGTATLTRKFVDAVRGTAADIYDTRKTTPGWRDLERYAVRCGGAHNHRRGLFDAILVKDNHLARIESGRLASHAFEVLNRAAELKIDPSFVEFEVDDLEQLEQLLKVVGIDVIMLDNFSLENMALAVRRRDELGLNGEIQLEASGGVTIEAIRAIAQSGVERISVGALTHSAPALDISLQLRR